MPVDDPATANAIRRQEERLARDPSSLAFAQLADLYRKVGRTREAVDLCREGLARYPQYATARLILAKTLIADGKLDEALAELTTLVEANPQDVQCRRLGAEVERRLGNIDGAVAHLEAVVRLDATDRDSRSLLTVLRATPGAGVEAGVARLLRDDTFVTASFGALCLEQGLAEEAAMVFTRMLRKYPNNLDARDRLEAALRARRRRG